MLLYTFIVALLKIPDEQCPDLLYFYTFEMAQFKVPKNTVYWVLYFCTFVRSSLKSEVSTQCTVSMYLCTFVMAHLTFLEKVPTKRC